MKKECDKMSKKKKSKKIKGLTIQFIPYVEIERLSSGERVKKILDIILKNKIVILQGKLFPEEETRLIEDTMVMVGHVKNFKGIELATINPNSNNLGFFGKFRHGLVKMLGGQESITIIGSASIVGEIKKDPSKMEVMMR